MENESLNSDIWLKKIATQFNSVDYEIIKKAILLVLKQPHLTYGLTMADILCELHLDRDTIVAAILYYSVQYAELSFEDVAKHFGTNVAKLILGTQQMHGISDLYQEVIRGVYYRYTIDNMRKMLLAMVDDIRVVLIKLAERLCVLRDAAILDVAARKKIAAETMAIYAPLTNRLGTAKIKWELEDLAFRYLEANTYQEIVTSLEQFFPERNQYIVEAIGIIEAVLCSAQIENLKVIGRAKHIYSIYRKMNRKKTGIEGLCDVSAIRIFVPTITDCYAVLSHIHGNWQYIPEEFDDYIASPKPNGYRSIHTAVYGPQNRIIEIQIRTYDMHREAELGIAAHWLYKEGKRQAVDYETKIAWLRQIMDWQQEVIKSEKVIANIKQMFHDQVYVFTPQGDIFELPLGATPIDFAYRVHTEIGHKCCGAKVNNSIVPLTYKLKTGDRVEILTSKNGHPSRDWLMPNTGFVKTASARAKIFQWFKKQIQEITVVQEEDLLDKKTPREESKKTIKLVVAKILCGSDIDIYGMGNLLVRFAGCCLPNFNDHIVGYVTRGQGIAVHKANCINVTHAKSVHPERFIVVNWKSKNRCW